MAGVVEFLSSLVEVESVNDPSAGRLVGVGEAEEVRRAVREHAGLDMELVENEGVPILLYMAGSGRPVTLFMAHFDVVPPGPGWRVTEPFKPVVKGGRLYGRGAADDKSNVAAISLALSGFEPGRGTVIIAFTGDEEIGGERGAGWLAGRLRSEGLWPDYVVNGDGSMGAVITRRRNVFNAIVRVRAERADAEGVSRRVMRLGLEVRGRPTRHAAYFIPGVDSHPLLTAAALVREAGLLASSLSGEWVKSNVLPASVELEALEPGGGGHGVYDPGLTALLKSLIPLSRITPGRLLYSDYGVTATPNVYRLAEGWHEVIVDVRAMTGDPAAVDEAVARSLEESLGSRVEWEYRVTGGGGYLYTPSSAELVKLALRVNQSLGLPGEPREAAGASDSRYFSPRGSQAIDYGPLGGNVHGPDEYVEIRQLEAAVEFYRRVAEALHG
ncbi:hypothetical protein APE_1917 [Aeropyrum pernix K1]|uniref:Peptidase n=1 Tax=Aeropyrum pernix (strain ATCC 700893 / DSM 11879 / JCM 9820 / NBRC 100138 / K1) TaxID=272557 RepID=Q9YAM6_AERPE|nr:M20/M25/M40 family metallo-hydrolase [Aeropyrum pernix]BAA80922.1 hypothetical protein APE_1917 [Aeropyrum pernix K1]